MTERPAHLDIAQPTDSANRDVETKQALRLQRFYMAVATYAGCGLLAQTCAWLGYLPTWLPLWWMAGFLAVNAVFYVMLRCHWNLRLADPSMTEAQLVVSMFAVMVLIYHADEARSIFLMLFPLPLMFGMLRLRLYQMARVGAVGVVGYASVITLLVTYHPERVQLAIEVLNLLALASVMGFVCLMGGYISKVRSELSRSLATIRDIAHHDPLTGVFNRRHLMGTLEREILRCERLTSHGFVLCMIDLDHFKRINDTLGHPVGDEVLVAVGKCINGSIRNTDYLARYGGEEFVVMLEGRSAELLRSVCERIRTDIAQLQMPALGELPLRVSIGVADYLPGERLTALIERADRGLYLAKEAGRNCIRMAPTHAHRVSTVVGVKLDA